MLGRPVGACLTTATAADSRNDIDFDGCQAQRNEMALSDEDYGGEILAGISEHMTKKTVEDM
jgi:hypothetical protein